MRHTRSRLLVVVPVLLAPALWVLGGGWFGGSVDGKGLAVGMRMAMAAEGTPNACGCYQDSAGSCFCGKKTRCGCPGQCEPKGCEEKREKEMRKEIEAETRKAREAGRRYSQGRNDKGAARGGAESSARESAHAREAEAPTRQHVKQKVTRMTAAQKKELLRLLELYSAEHGDTARHTLDQVRGNVRGELATGSP